MAKSPTKTGNGKEKKPVRSIRLRSARDAQRMLARVVRETYQNRIPPKKAYALIYGLRSLIDSFRTTNLEEKMDELEKQINEYRREYYTNGRGRDTG